MDAETTETRAYSHFSNFVCLFAYFESLNIYERWKTNRRNNMLA